MKDSVQLRLRVDVHQRVINNALTELIDTFVRRLRRSSVRRQLCFESVVHIVDMADDMQSDAAVRIQLLNGAGVCHEAQLGSAELNAKRLDGELLRINKVLAVEYPWAAMRWRRYRWAIETAKHDAHVGFAAQRAQHDNADAMVIARQLNGYVQSAHESARCPMVLFDGAGDGTTLAAVAHWTEAQRSNADLVVLAHDVNATLSADCHIDIVRRIGHALKESWLPEIDVFGGEYCSGEDDEADAVLLLERWLALLPANIRFVLVLFNVGVHSYTLASSDDGSASSSSSSSSSSMLHMSAPYSAYVVPPTRGSERPSARSLLEWLPRRFATDRLRVVALSIPDADAMSLATECGWPHFVTPSSSSSSTIANADDDNALDTFERDASASVCVGDARLARDVLGMIALSRHGLTLLDLQRALCGRAADATVLALLQRAIDAGLLDEALAVCQLRYRPRSATVARRVRRRFAEHRHRAMLADSLERAKLIDTGTAAKLGELPYQLRDAEQWQRLERVLGNMGVLSRMTRHSAALRRELVDHLRTLKREQQIEAPLSVALNAYSAAFGARAVATKAEHRADMLVIIGRLASSIGNTELAERCFRDALALIEPVRGVDDPCIVAQLCHWIGALADDADYARRALDIVQRRLVGPFDHRVQRMQRLCNRLEQDTDQMDQDSFVH